jgi:hypothetical protein
MTAIATDKLIVRTESSTWSFAVAKASLSLGNDPRLVLHVPHAEVAARAATIDNRGSAPMIVNHSPFAIYVGREKLEPGGCVIWKPGAPVQLTRSVSLEFAADQKVAEATRELPPTASATFGQNRQLVPIAVILACCVLGASMLFGGESGPAVVESISVQNLNEDIQRLGGLLPERSNLYNRLQESLRAACLTDHLWRGVNPQKVVDAYRQLLNSEIVRRPSKAEANLARNINRFGSERIQQLWLQMDYQ